MFCSHCGSQVGEPAPGAESRRRPSAESIASGEQRLLKALRDATLGEYEVLSEIGRGGMAVVFLAHDISLDRRVAIKCMSPALMMMDKGIQERFKREARTAASLSHPHIIPVFAVKESKDLVFFVMKYIKGRSLESVIKEVGPLPIPIIQTILNQAGAALGHAHRRGVVHRDVKPGNLMLDEDGWLVMTDFGIAKVAQAEALTMTGGMVGTPAYMSPEQCQGSDVAGAADQYSLGIVAYEMLAGKPPFLSQTMVNMIYDHCHTPPPSIADLRADCPPTLAAAVMKMIEKEPAFRFHTIEEAVAAVGEVTETQDVVRTRMLTLVQSPATAKLLDKFRTPGSPVPRPRTGSPALLSVSAPPSTAPTPATPAPQTVGQAVAVGKGGKSWLAWAVPVGVAAVVGVFLLGRSGSAPRTGAVDTGAVTEAIAPVPARLDVTPMLLALTVGDQAALSAVPRDSLGAALPGGVQWEALDPRVATVSADGVVRAMATGQGRVVARSGGSSGTVVVTVQPAALAPPAARGAPATGIATVAVAPTAVSLTVGETTGLSASARNADGAALPDRRVTWTSSEPRVASVSSEGTLTANAVGSTAVTASSDGYLATVSVTVTEAAVAAIAVEPSQLTLTVGAGRPLTATARDASGSPLVGRRVTWRSSNNGVVSVDADGSVSAVGPGSATVVASAGAASASVTVTVTRPAVTEPAADPRAEVRQLVEQYRQAIEARQVAGIRRLYPALTAPQERAWNAFFGNVSELSARLEITSFEAADDSARATVAAVYDFRADRRQTQNTSFTMRFRRTATGWQIVSVQ